MSTREDTLDIIPNDFMRFEKNGSVIQGTWKKIENHKIYANWLGKQLGYETREDWYKITKKIIQEHRGGGLLKGYYNSSPQQLLKYVYPDTEWLPWKFTSACNNYWDDKENHKIYADWLGKKLGYKTKEDWYKITKKIVYNNYGGGLLNGYYNNTPSKFIQNIFTEYKWLLWKFTQTNRKYWKEKENHKIYAIWLGEELGFKTMEDWYKITGKDFHNNYGGGLLASYYKDSPLTFVTSVFPDINWLPWKFAYTPTIYWKEKENHKLYADWLGEELGFKTMEDWYKITGKVFHNNYGGGLLGNYYKDSPLKFIQSVFPDIDWLPWKFIQTPHCYWKEKENHKLYADWLEEELGFKTMEDWYKIIKGDFEYNNGCGLLYGYYNNSPSLFVTSIYPDYPWDLSKFKKNYSQGQLEWLNCLIIKKYPDIRHVLNHNDGEYSIPNSRYHADGYSKTKNLILEYHGDRWHGNPEIYNQEDINPVTKTTYGELYQKTLEKQRFCEESGYNYISIWESEWFRFKNSIIQLQRIFKEKQEANF
tara:strand:+ start:235 stop:1836 length:1602 start_codon:yes stop_codon:yes gene_type:complete